MEIDVVWSVAFAFVPGLFWAWFWLRRDRHNPEPIRLLAFLFVLGILTTLPAVGVEMAADLFLQEWRVVDMTRVIVWSLLIVAPVEEIAKYLVVREFAARNGAVDEPRDVVVYATILALGFATAENVLVAITGGHDAVFLRFATATLLHPIATGIAAYYLALSLFDLTPHPKRTAAQGVVIAILLHGLYNIIASTNTPLTPWLLVALLLISIGVLLLAIRELKQLWLHKHSQLKPVDETP